VSYNLSLGETVKDKRGNKLGYLIGYELEGYGVRMIISPTKKAHHDEYELTSYKMQIHLNLISGGSYLKLLDH
jgi:hypothetical protein